MNALKPCPKCGSKKLFDESEKHGFLYGYGIGCLNLDCSQGLLIRYGFTKKGAKKRAVGAWNRRAVVERKES